MDQLANYKANSMFFVMGNRIPRAFHQLLQLATRSEVVSAGIRLVNRLKGVRQYSFPGRFSQSRSGPKLSNQIRPRHTNAK
jgi:hypothetical protein